MRCRGRIGIAVACVALALLATVRPVHADLIGREVITTAVSCANTVTAIVPANGSRVTLVLLNISGSTIYIGQSSGAPALTTANGLPLVTNASLTLYGFQGAMSCIVAGANLEIRVMEMHK